MIMRTFQAVFPEATVWRGLAFPGFYLIGSVEPLEIDPERFRQAYQDKDFLADLTEWDNQIPTAWAMLSLYLLSPDELADFASGAPIITDDHPYTEFPLWRQTFDYYGKQSINALGVEYWRRQTKGIQRPTSRPPSS